MSDPANAATTVAPRLARALQALVSGFTYLSEADYPYRSFSAKMPKTTELTPESFRSAVGIGRRYAIEMRSPDAFFEWYQNPEEQDPEQVGAFTLLEDVMRATLSELHWVHIGVDEFTGNPWDVYARVFIFGRTQDGDLAGLSTRAVET